MLPAPRALPTALKQIAYARRADADEHLHEVRARQREERHVRLAGDGAREQRLTGARRSDQQDAFGNSCSELAELLG
jgi:hypothetical protein